MFRLIVKQIKLMKLSRSTCKELLWSLILALLIPVWIGLAPVFYNWFLDKDNGLWIKWLYRLLDGQWLVNIPVCIVIVCLFTFWCNKVWKDNDIRGYRFVLIIIGLVFLYWDSPIDYAKKIGHLDYRHFFTCLLVIAFVVITKVLSARNRIINLLNKEENNNKQKRKEETVLKNNYEEIPENLKVYAGLIVEKAVNTKANQKSSAIGVTGKWGVGKTTFLNLLKDKLKDKAEVVEFNPWMCRTPDQVIQNFFSSLRHQLSPKYSSLSKSIREYASYLNSFTVSPNIGFSIDMSLITRNESLYERKKHLSEKFSRLLKPVVVIIDDVDRLEREEVFEVLRLIRNTADLKNTIYIVAYDKEYVTGVLEEKNIKDASSYLEKIFPVEIHLPKVEDYLIWKAFRSEMFQQDTSDNKIACTLFKNFNNNERALILSILDNYRRAKRFAQLYMFNAGYLNHILPGEINFIDLFWLELLQMYDKKTYDSLSREPILLLFQEGDKLIPLKGILTKDIENVEYEYKGERFWKNNTPHILKMIFDFGVKREQQSICYIENYEKYFTLDVSPYKLSIKEFKELFIDGVDSEELVKNWLENGKYPYSIAYQLNQIKVNNLEENKLKNLITGTLFFGLCIAPDTNSQLWIVKNILQLRQYAENIKDYVKETVISWLKSKLDDSNNEIEISYLLNKIYPTVDYKKYRKGEHIDLVISSEELENMLKKCMSIYLKNHKEVSVLGLMAENSDLFKIFKNCCIQTEKSYMGCNYYKQIVIDIVINHFEEMADKPKVEDFYDSFYKLFNITLPELNADLDWDRIDGFSPLVEDKIKSMFGSSCYENDNNKLVEFVNKCFAKKIVLN